MSADTPIKAVVFDAVGTVMYPSPPVATAYERAILKHCGVTLPADVAVTAVRAALSQRSVEGDLTTSEDQEHQFWADLIRTLCPNQAPGFHQCFDDLFAHFASPENWRCFDDVQDTLSTLQQAGLVVAVASNFDRRLHSVCNGLKPLANVDTRIISSEIGWRKPAPQFFEAVTRTLGLPADQILMVGDDLTNDIQGALDVGMQAAWICRNNAPANSDVHRISSLTKLPQMIAELPTSGND